MNAKLTPQEKPLLDLFPRVRLILPETAAYYPKLSGISTEAVRKRIERLVEKEFLAASKLPSGRQVYRLSKKGAKLTGAPVSWSDSPTEGILAESLPLGALAWKTEDYRFPTRTEFQELLLDLGGAGATSPLPPRVGSSRFVLRILKGAKDQRSVELDYFLSELRPAPELARRAEIVAKSLNALPIFQKLITHGLLGILIAVPSEGVRATLQANSFSLPTNAVVVPELLHLAAT